MNIVQSEYLKQCIEFPNHDDLGYLWKEVTKHKIICIDVANGYTEKFVNYVRTIRGLFPDHILIAGNVVTREMTEALIQKLLKLAKTMTVEEKSEEDGDEHFDLYVRCDGQLDDAYEIGIETGGIKLARDVLTQLGIDWK